MTILGANGKALQSKEGQDCIDLFEEVRQYVDEGDIIAAGVVLVSKDGHLYSVTAGYRPAELHYGLGILMERIVKLASSDRDRRGMGKSGG